MQAAVKLAAPTGPLEVLADKATKQMILRVAALATKLQACPSALPILANIERNFPVNWKRGQAALERIGKEEGVAVFSLVEGNAAFTLTSALLFWSGTPIRSLNKVRTAQEMLALVAFCDIPCGPLPPANAIWKRPPDTMSLQAYQQLRQPGVVRPLPLAAALHLLRDLSRDSIDDPEIMLLRVHLTRVTAVWYGSTRLFKKRMKGSLRS